MLRLMGQGRSFPAISGEYSFRVFGQNVTAAVALTQPKDDLLAMERTRREVELERFKLHANSSHEAGGIPPAARSTIRC